MDPRPNPALLLGSVIHEKYRLQDVIGRGGMGTVYRAEHVVTRRSVAVKIIHPWIIAATPITEQRFLREAEAPASLKHPAIVEVLDAGRDDAGHLYLVFELLEGEDLAMALGRGDLSAPRIVEIMIELLGVLEVAHANGFVHRDIKPANVFLALDPNGGPPRVKLLDFGIAKRLDVPDPGATTQPGTVVGTSYYMSPEQALGEAVDHRADLWSAGALLFRALAGTPALYASNPIKLTVKLATERPPSLAERCPLLPPQLIAVVDRALDPDPECRFASATEMREALSACFAEHPSLDVPLPEPVVVEVKQPISRATVLLATLIGLLAGTLIWLMSTSAPEQLVSAVAAEEAPALTKTIAPSNPQPIEPAPTPPPAAAPSPPAVKKVRVVREAPPPPVLIEEKPEDLRRAKRVYK